MITNNAGSGSIAGINSNDSANPKNSLLFKKPLKRIAKKLREQIYEEEMKKRGIATNNF